MQMKDLAQYRLLCAVGYNIQELSDSVNRLIIQVLPTPQILSQNS